MGKCKDETLHPGQVCGGCLTSALPEHAFTAVRMKEKGCGASQRGFNHSRPFMAQNVCSFST